MKKIDLLSILLLLVSLAVMVDLTSIKMKPVRQKNAVKYLSQSKRSDQSSVAPSKDFYDDEYDDDDGDHNPFEIFDEHGHADDDQQHHNHDPAELDPFHDATSYDIEPPGVSGSSSDVAGESDPVEDKILFLFNYTRCKMFSKKCFIRVIVTDLSITHRLRVKSSDRKFADLVNKTVFMESCGMDTEISNYSNSKIVATAATSNLSLFECNAMEKQFNNSLYYAKPHLVNLSSRNFFLIRVKPKLVGIKFVEFSYVDPVNESNRTVRHKFVISSPDRFIDTIQMAYVLFFSITIALIMGILIELETLIKIIKVPWSVLIGFVSQYLFMPLLSFAFIKIFKLPPVEALALFIYGCSPGGSGSNNWTIIFDGDIDLSAIMTFVSTVSSIFMMPLWFYSLGRTLSRKAEINIPFMRLVLNLLLTIFPCLLGIALSRRFPRLKKFLMKYARKIVLFLIISFLVIILIAKYYVLSLVTWQQWLQGPLIPWTGFLLGAFVAWLFKRPFKHIYTISIETGLQNVGIAYMIVMLNFPSPESDYALLPLVAISSITTVPLWLILIIKSLYTRIKEARERKSKTGKPLTVEQEVIFHNNKNNARAEETVRLTTASAAAGGGDSTSPASFNSQQSAPTTVQ